MKFESGYSFTSLPLATLFKADIKHCTRHNNIVKDCWEFLKHLQDIFIKLADLPNISMCFPVQLNLANSMQLDDLIKQTNQELCLMSCLPLSQHPSILYFADSNKH